jgi:thiol-disulfide isomerase/thioredoxin
MRLPVTLGFVFALLVGVVVIALIVAGIADQPPVAATLPPVSTPVAMVTPSPTPTAVPTPTPTVPGATPTTSGSPVTVGTAIGQRAPDFVLPHLAGGELSTADSRGKALWVNFMATWCPQCQDELPMMMRMASQVGEPMDIIVVDVGEDEQTVSDFIVGLGVDLPIALDVDGTVQQQWAALALPVHFWVDSSGIVQEIVYGGAPPELFQAAIRKVVPEASFPAP